MAKEKTIKLNVDAKDAIKQVDELNHGITSTDEAAAGSKHGFAIMKESVLGVSLAFKAMGIGLIVSAFVTLKNMLGQNQTVMDKLSVISESMGFVFQKVINIVVELGTKMTKAFSDPKQAVEDLWIALKNNIVNRFEGLIDTFGALGKVIQGVFKRDLDMIKEGASEAGTALIQLGTGFDEEQQQKMSNGFNKIANEIKNTAKEATEYGKAITQMRNEVKLAEANQRQLQLTYQKDAELQRQLRDDISLTFEERIAANEELGRVLDEQFSKEQVLAQKKIDLAQMELDQNKDNVDLQVALINSKTEMADLDERITGQRSEQLVNLKGLEKEYQESLKKTEVVAKKTGEAEVKIAKLTAANKRDIIANSLGQVASLMGEESKAGKALAVGQALINTYSAATAALAPPPIGAGPIFGPIAAIGAVAAGMANVKSILSTKLPGDDGGGGGGPDPSIPSPTGMVGDLSPNMEAISGPTLGGVPPVQAYVVENDISNAQALQEELDIQATL